MLDRLDISATLSKHRLASSAIFLILLMGSLSNCRQIQVPSITVPNRFDLKLGRYQQITQPGFEFEDVYSRKVYKTQNNQMSSFPPCHENKPEISFNVINSLLFAGHPEKKPILYKFDDIKYSQFLLDAFYDQDYMYLIFEDAMVAVTQIKKRQMGQSKVFPIHGIDQNQQLQPGYFVKTDKNIFFVNGKFIISVYKDKAISYRVDGYEANQNFQSAISIQDQFIAVAFRQKGVFFYKVVTNEVNSGTGDPGVDNDPSIKVQKIHTLNPPDIATNSLIQVADIAYYKQKKSLFVLDQDHGVVTFSVYVGDINSDKALIFSQRNILLKRQACDLMHLYDTHLYLGCGQIYRVSLQDWPKIEQKTLPHPNIKIRQIYAQGPLVAFIGRSVFKLMYLDRLVNYYQDQRLDKLIFKNDMFFSVNQGSMMIGQFQIIPPYVSCRTDQQKYLGFHSLVFKTVAQCNKDFFSLYKIPVKSLGEINTKQDTCIYTVYRTAYVWKTGKVLMLPLIIVGSILIVITVVIALMWVIKKIRLRRIQHQLAEYSTLLGGGTEKGDKHHQLVEQQPESQGNNKSGAANRVDEQGDDNKKPSELQLHGGNNYDIQ